ncbi:hypothetical protein D3C86_1161570 [compost metagenome]
MIGSRNDAFARFQRLAKRIQHLRRKFRELIQKKNAVMGKRSFARFGTQPSADQRRHGGGMVRRAERPAVRQLATRQLAGDGMDHGHFQQLRHFQRGQDGRQAGCEHGFTRTGWADHQQIMAASGGHLQRAPGTLLSLDVS